MNLIEQRNFSGSVGRPGLLHRPCQQGRAAKLSRSNTFGGAGDIVLNLRETTRILLAGETDRGLEPHPLHQLQAERGQGYGKGNPDLRG